MPHSDRVRLQSRSLHKLRFSAQVRVNAFLSRLSLLFELIFNVVSLLGCVDK